MRILIAHCRYRQYGGEDSVVDAERELLTSGGVEVDFFEVTNSDSTTQATLQLFQAPANLHAARQLSARVSAAHFDAIHIHNTWFGLSPAVISAALNSGVRTVVTLHNYRSVCPQALLTREDHQCRTCVGSSSWPAIRHRCVGGSFAQSAIGAATSRRLRAVLADPRCSVIVPSDSMRSVLVDGGVPADQLATIGHFVRDPGPRIGTAESSRRVVAAGRLSPEKGFEEIIEAWALAPEGLELHIFGDGPCRTAIEHAAQTCPRPVTVHGKVSPEAVTAELRSARAFVSGSTAPESFGLSVAEALAAGVGVIAYDVGSFATLIDRAGIVVPCEERRAGRIDRLGTALRALADDQLMADWSFAARTQYEAKLTAEHHLSALLKMYRGTDD